MMLRGMATHLNDFKSQVSYIIYFFDYIAVHRVHHEK